MWAVAFYHEDEAAPEVVEMVNDILWLHRAYYTAEKGGGSVYKEGVIQCAHISRGSTHAVARVQSPVRNPWGVESAPCVG